MDIWSTHVKLDWIGLLIIHGIEVFGRMTLDVLLFGENINIINLELCKQKNIES